MNRWVTIAIFSFIINFVSYFVSLSDDKIEVIHDDNNIVIYDKNAHLNCNTKIIDEVQIQNNTIRIIQIDTSSTKSFCECNFDLIHTLHNIPNGKFKIEIFRDELKKYGYTQDKRYLVSTSEVEISDNNGKSGFYYEFRQSSCKNSQKTSTNSNLQFESIKLEVFPNPVKNELSIKFYTFTNLNAKFVIYNLIGKEIFSYEIKNLEEGLQTWNLNIPNIPQGIYLGKIILSNGKFETVKIVWSK